MKYQNGLRVYGVYKFEHYSKWNILITDFEEYPNGESIKGLAFNKKGEFETGVNLRLPMEYIEVGYIYPYQESNSKLSLNLAKDKLPVTKEDILDSDLEQTELDRIKKIETKVDYLWEHLTRPR